MLPTSVCDVMDAGTALVLFVERVEPDEILLSMACYLHAQPCISFQVDDLLLILAVIIYLII